MKMVPFLLTALLLALRRSIKCLPVTIRLVLVFAAVAMAPSLRAQDGKQQETPSAGQLPAPFAAAISKADLDPAAFTHWVDGVEGSALTWADKPFDPVRLFWTREASQDYVGGWSFGDGTNLEPRHLRVGWPCQALNHFAILFEDRMPKNS
jgi:hypothetical protein